MPSAGKPVPDVQPNKDGSVTIQYVPTQSGVHELNLSFNEAPVEGMPFRVNVDAVDGHFVSAYGPGLIQGASGEKLHFNVTKGSAVRDLEVTIEGPGKADIVKKEDKNGVLAIDYIPLSPGEYNINVKKAGKHIYGSPFSAKISGEGSKKSHLTISTPSEYTLGGNDVDLTGLVGYTKTPMSTVEQCPLKKLANGKLAIATFQPKKKGTYSVDVTQDGTRFQGSPFQIQVGDSELCSASKVKVQGAIKEAMANQWNDLNVNVTGAGYGNLGVTTEGSHRVDLQYKQAEFNKNEYIVQYRPPEPGIYLLSVKYGDDHTTGSPFMVSVGGKPSGRVKETVTKQIQSPEMVIAGQPTELHLKMPSCSALDMEAILTSPTGKTELCEIRDQPGSLFIVKFTPNEKGLNILSLKIKGIHINGSPLPFTVGSTPAGGNHKVEFGGTGAERGSFGILNEFNIYTHEAGPGILSVSIEGPSKANIELIDTRSGFVTCAYTVERDGEYTIGVKYNNEHVPRSPCKVQIDPECKEAKKVTIHGLRDRGLEVEKPATFTVNLNGVQGVLKGHVVTPSGIIEDIVIQELDNELNSVRFLPKENGVYYVSIKFNDAHIPGSPLPMLIGKLGADPALVQAHGEGLESGVTGSPCKFVVVTANAGAGTMAVTVEGTSKVAVICTEVDEGYEFSYTPSAPGDYMINIRFCNVSLAGSPFKAAIVGEGKPSEVRELSGLQMETQEKKPGTSKCRVFHGDASKVVIQGTGLKKGFLSRIGTFTMELKDAGQALLIVAMVSPSGYPVKELTCKKQKAGVYVVTYQAEEKGDHFLHVKWGADDVPGSPFLISMS